MPEHSQEREDDVRTTHEAGVVADVVAVAVADAEAKKAAVPLCSVSSELGLGPKSETFRFADDSDVETESEERC
jgi:hypothetical protein